jgi:hypothetical protein
MCLQGDLDEHILDDYFCYQCNMETLQENLVMEEDLQPIWVLDVWHWLYINNQMRSTPRNEFEFLVGTLSCSSSRRYE